MKMSIERTIKLELSCEEAVLIADAIRNSSGQYNNDFILEFAQELEDHAE